MDHVTGVEVAETISDLGQLDGSEHRVETVGGTYEFKSVCTGVVLNVFRQIPAKHPIRNELEGSDGNTEEWEDVWVCHPLPHYGFLAEALQVLLVMVNGRSEDANNAPW